MGQEPLPNRSGDERKNLCIMHSVERGEGKPMKKSADRSRLEPQVIQRDRKRVGLLVPATDTTVEVDLYRNLPHSITLHAARMPLAGVTVADEERMLDEGVPRASEEVASLDPDVVVFACTSAGALHGPPGDAELAARISRMVHRPVITVFGSVLETLRIVQAKRLLVFTPYTDELNARLQAALVAGGVPVESIWGMGLLSDVEIGRLDPAVLLTRLQQRVGETHPDCVFMSCTNLRAWEMLATAQQKLGTLVVSSNFLVYRAILRALSLPVPSLERPSWGVA